MMISAILSRLVILLFGTLYPVYASFKTVKSQDPNGYVHWMMYWIVFGTFTATENFTDVFLCWLPFYYEIKIIFIFWLLSSTTKGSTILYKQVLHPLLSQNEEKIDEYISRTKQSSYNQFLKLCTKSFNIVVPLIIKGLAEFSGKCGIFALDQKLMDQNQTSAVRSDVDTEEYIYDFQRRQNFSFDNDENILVKSSNDVTRESTFVIPEDDDVADIKQKCEFRRRGIKKDLTPKKRR